MINHVVVFVYVVCCKVVDVDGGLCLVPFVGSIKSFGVDVGCLEACGDVCKVEVWLIELFFQPGDVDAVCSGEVAHGGIAASVANPNHCGVVLMEEYSVVVVQEQVPALYGWNASLS